MAGWGKAMSQPGDILCTLELLLQIAVGFRNVLHTRILLRLPRMKFCSKLMEIRGVAAKRVQNVGFVG